MGHNGPTWRTLLDGEVQSSDDATKILKLPKSGALHALMVKVAITNGATDAKDAYMFDVIDQVEVIGEGSQVIYSLQLTEIEKLYELRFGQPLNLVQDEQGGAVQSVVFPIMFGREFYDAEYYLPSDRFSDTELKIKYSPTIAATAGFATGTVTIDVLGLISTPAPPTYSGTLVTRTIESFTSAASGDQIVDFHLQNILRSVMVYAYEAAVADETDITKVILRANDGEYDLFNANWGELLDMNYALFGADIEHRCVLNKSDTDTWATRLGRLMLAEVHHLADVNITNDTFLVTAVDTLTGDRITLNQSQADITAAGEDLTAYTTDGPIMVRAVGQGPGYAVLLPFDYSPDPSTWLDTNQLSRLQALLTQGGAGATCRVSVEEVRRF